MMTPTLSYESLSYQDFNQLTEMLTLFREKREGEFWSMLESKELSQLENFISHYPDDFSTIPFKQVNIDFNLSDLDFVQRFHSLIENHSEKTYFFYRLFTNTYRLTPESISYGLFHKGLLNRDSFIVMANSFPHEFLPFAYDEMNKDSFKMSLEFLLCLEPYYSQEKYHYFITKNLNKLSDLSIWNHFKEKEEYHHLFSPHAKTQYLIKHVLGHNPQAYIPDYANDPFFKELFLPEANVIELYSAVWNRNNIPSFQFFFDNYDLKPKFNEHSGDSISYLCDSHPYMFNTLLPLINNHKKLTDLFLNRFYHAYDYSNSNIKNNFISYMEFISTQPELVASFQKKLKGYSVKNQFHEDCHRLLFKHGLENTLSESSSAPKVKL